MRGRALRAVGPLSAGAALLGALLAARPAAADPTEADLKAARQLFADAGKDEDAGRWVDALAKLRQVAGVKLTAGIRYHIALCDEHLGHLAAALEGFTAAQTQAQADRALDVQRLVGAHLATLGPRVPRLTVNVTPPVAGAAVRIDDTPLPVARVGTAIPLDPGPHTVAASAEGHAPASVRLDLGEHDTTVLDLTLPELSAPAAPAAPPPAVPSPPAAGPSVAPPARPAQSGPSSTAAIVATVGTIALAGGGIAAFVAAGDAVTSGTAQCASEATDAPCTSQKNTVRAWDFMAAGAWTAAAALGVVAVVLWTGGHAGAPEAAILVGPASAGVGGRF